MRSLHGYWRLSLPLKLQREKLAVLQCSYSWNSLTSHLFLALSFLFVCVSSVHACKFMHMYLVYADDSMA